MHRKIVPALLAAALMGGAGAHAAAAEPAAETTVKVRVAGLDLESDAGARIALARIHRAAGKVCGGEPETRLLDRRAAYDGCVREAVDRTVASAHSSRLTALNGAKERDAQLASAR